MYYYEKKSSKSLEEVERLVRASLKERGFGVLTEIDAQQTLKEKMGIDMQGYKILGACNPKYAHKVILQEPHVGVLLPCNVLLREEGDSTHVSCILPSIQMSVVGNKDLCQIADHVELLLKEVVDEVCTEQKTI